MGTKKAAPAEKPARVRRRVITETVEQDEPTPTGSGTDTSEPAAFEETDDIRDFSGYDRNLREYMENAGGVKEFTATLYKYDAVNQQKQYVCHSQANEVLTMHDAGMLLGSGSYRYLITFPPELKIAPKAFRFNIHTIYDSYRERAGLGGPSADPRGPAAGLMVNPGRSSLAETIELMKSVVEVLRPMMAPPSNNAMESILANYAMTQDVLKRNLNENVSLYREIAALHKTREPETEEEERPGIMETLVPLIEKFAPLLFGNGPTSAALVQTVKSAPQFKQVLGNPGELKAVISEIEKTLGKDKANEVLKKLNVKRPA